ncbi:uncharacterized protein F4822DRAFT_410870 [Hypoxylon trugodes]|uniref:uncharacterized protein n=1 Tax=Hypoxylon trugodes TaxID=326681 RepID=UPI00219B5797|nr:uncharacterized protein F4822DRAFT_410870 [Hypoxylon trugodes]KAI1386665.1 hypothetical protein F4822DRAFT_410870 [Hypoxylon trugodes]
MGELSAVRSSTNEYSGWDEERTEFLRAQPKSTPKMGLDREWWMRHIDRHLLMKKFDFRRLLIAFIAIVGLSIVVFEVTHHDLYRLAPFQRPSADIGTPGQCTTWPVDREGQYTPLRALSNGTAPKLKSHAPKTGWKKPTGIRIVALVFYGRKRTVDFLDCYLQQNLVTNGGYLDEIRFMVHTNKEEDLKYLEELVAQREEHYHIVQGGECEGSSYGCIWDSVVEENTIYVKIDDDIVFIHPDAIPQLVHTRIATPHPFAVSANLVNSPLTGYEHFHVGAIHAFRPDPREKPSHFAAESWRPSEKDLFPSSDLPELNISDVDSIDLDAEIFPNRSYYGHPFLLLSNDNFDLMKTPMGLNYLRGGDKGVESMYEAAWKSWAIASQQQYSLLKNLEDNAISRYFFGSPMEFTGPKNTSTVALKHYQAQGKNGPGAEQLYNTQYKRYNLNFVALWGHDIKAALPIAEDDEQDITVTIPKRTRRPFVIDTRSVVGHLSFYPQHEGVRETDLLDRWRAFANDMICSPRNQKTPFDVRCPGF